MRNPRVTLLLVALIGTWLLGVCPILVGQGQRAIILGRVLDPQGRVMPGVEVKVIEQSTNISRTTTTNESGNYEVPGLSPGTYRVEAAAVAGGFKQTVVTNVSVTSAQRVELNINMQVGLVATKIEVTAQPAMLDTADANANTVFNKLAELPIGQGNATYLFLMSPGVDQASGWGGWGQDIMPMQRYGASLARFNGAPTGATEYTIEGAPNMQHNNAAAGGGVAFNLSPDVVQEVRIQTNTFDASVGHNGGSQVDLEMKSGTNIYHGSAYGFVRPPSWSANSWSGNHGGIPKPDHFYRRWGFSGGGPVWLGPLYKGKNRTFFYYGFEKWAAHDPNNPVFATVPQPQELTGDFSGLLALGPQYQLYDPDTAQVAANGRIQRNPFPNNIIPPSRIDPTAAALLKLWPAPNVTGTADGRLNYTYDLSSSPRRLWSSTLRLDHSLTSSHLLSGRLLLGVTDIPFWTLYGQKNISITEVRGPNRDVAVNDVWTISPTFVADFRAAVMRFRFDVLPMGLGIPYAQLGLKSMEPLMDTKIAGIPSVTVDGYPQLEAIPSQTAFTNFQGSRSTTDVRTLAANFTKTFGNHSVKFGVDTRWYFYNTGIDDQLTVNFQGLYTNGPFDNSPAPPIGAGLADFLLGRYSSAVVSQPGSAANLSTYQGIHVNDDWKITPRLKLNIGVRYEREGPSTERYNKAVSGFAFGVDNPIAAQAKAAYAMNPIAEIPPSQFQVKGGLLFAGVNGNPRTVYNYDNNNIAPRIGLTYELSPKMVLRTGYGIFFVPYGQRFFANESGIPGFDTTTFSFSSLDGGLTFPGNLQNPFPSGLQQPVGASLGLASALGQGLFIPTADRNLPNAYSQRWELSIQRIIANEYRLEIRYVGNRTLKMPIAKDFNALPNKYLSTSTERDQATIDHLSELVPNPFVGIPGVSGSLGTSTVIPRSSLLVAFPEFASVTIDTPQGWSTYHALQVEFERRLATGLKFQTSYTWSKTIDALGYLNVGDPIPEKAISDYDRTHVLRVMATWELPFGKGRRFASNQGNVIDHLVSGWQIHTIFFIESGDPWTWGNVLFRGNIKDVPISNRTPERQFNTDAGFEKDPAKQLAFNLRTFPSRLPGVRNSKEQNTDLSIFKDTPINERFTVQFRAEFYNAWNQHYFNWGHQHPNLDPTSSAFGTTNLDSPPRKVQLGLKLVF